MSRIDTAVVADQYSFFISRSSTGVLFRSRTHRRRSPLLFNLVNRTNYANPLLPNFAIDFLQNGIDPATNRGIGFLPLTATPDVAGGNPFLGGGGPRAVQLAAKILF